MILDEKIKCRKVKDVNILLNLEKSIFNDLAWSCELLEKELQNNYSITYLLFIDNEPIGYSIVRKIIDEAEILRFGIKREWQGRGLGQYLLNYVINEMLINNVDKIFLELRRDNIKALNLYKKLGFELLYIRKAYYTDGSDALLMCKKLNLLGG